MTNTSLYPKNCKFLNLHLLTAYNVACLNRDEDSLPKSAFIGGVRRNRISSQCLKRALRTSEGYRKLFGDSSIRTRNPEELAGFLLSKPGFAVHDERVIRYILNSNMSSADGKKDVVVSVMPEEVKDMAGEIEAFLRSEGLTPDDLPDMSAPENTKTAEDEPDGKKDAKKKKGKVKKTDMPEADRIRTEIEGIMKRCGERVLKSGLGTFDIALSGRMCTSGFFRNVEAALSLSHAVTVHPADRQIDWFSAVDDAVSSGAAHLDTQEFGGGVFYAYACVNLDLLAHNLGIDRKSGSEDLLRKVGELAVLLASVSPNGKQHAMAARSRAGYILLHAGNSMISLDSAFEKPVRSSGEGFFVPAVSALENHVNRLGSAWDDIKNDSFAVMNTVTDNAPALDSLSDVSMLNSSGDMIRWISEVFR